MTAFAVATILLAQQQPAVGPAAIKALLVKTVAAKSVTVPDPAAKATVLLFMMSDCPIANRFAPEIQRIEADYREKGVVCYRVYPYVGATKEEVDQHTKDFGYKFPAILDTAQRLVKAVGARVSPEAVLIAKDGTIVYRGRVDDSYADHGRYREGDYRHDLRIALDEFLAGKPVSLPRTTALGCYLQ